MRNLSLYAILLLLFFRTHAQNPIQTKIDSMLVNIDQTAFTSGILYDRTVPWSSLSNFNDSHNTSNKNHFEQALLEIHNASNKELFMDHNQLQQLSTSNMLKNVVDMGILNVSFHHLNYNKDHEEEGALRKQTQLFERINNTKEVFLERHALVISPLKKNVKGETITFKFKEEFLFQSSLNKDITRLEIDFGTGETYTVIENGILIQAEIIINYDTDGEKTIEATAQLSDGSTKTTLSLIQAISPVTSIPNNNFIEDVYGFESEYSFKGYESGDIAIKGKLDYRIFYRAYAPSPTLRKPIIIIDGFDPGDKRKIQDSDSDLAPEDHNSIEEMMKYPAPSGETISLISLLTNEGYDVIIVNHPHYTSSDGTEIDGGADYIERNALTHVTLYEHINQLLIENNSNEELVIIGPSMGGQISRYALAYMEANGIDHNTRLWVSIDSPHLGANIPIGLQTLVRQVMPDNAMAQEFVHKQLGSPAAKQQLIEQLDGWNISNVHQNYLNGKTISQGFAETRGHPFFTQYYNNLFNNGLEGSNGYPQNLRKIALVNGSLKGLKNYDIPTAENVGTYANDGQIALNIRAFQSICAPWPFQANCWDVLIGSLESYTMPAYGENKKISRYKNGFDDDDKFVFNNNTRGNMDNIPGGYFNGYSQLADPVNGTDPIQYDGVHWYLFLDQISDVLGDAISTVYANEQVHSFIPTISSLGFNNPDISWNQNLDRNLVCTNEIPFDNYFGPKNNQPHTSFTKKSVDWILAELNEEPLPPTVYNEETAINGPNIICVNDIVTYDFDHCASADVEEWQVSPALQIITSDQQSVTVSSINTNEYYNNEAWIKAIYPEHEILKELWIGRPDNPGGIIGPDEVNVGSFNNYRVASATGATNYVWSLPEPFDPDTDIVDYIDGNSDHWQMKNNAYQINNGVFSGNGSHEGEVRVMGVNSCGEGNFSSLYVTQFIDSNCITCLDPIDVVPYPNTSNVAFKLDFRQHGEGTYYIYIYDEHSNIIYQGESSNIEKTVYTEDIPPGTYFLHIYEGERVKYQQLHIDH